MVRELLSFADTDKDGLVDFSEFLKMLTKDFNNVRLSYPNCA